MRLPCILFFSLVVAGCAGSKEQMSLNGTQATLLARRLANNQAAFLFQCQPFHDCQPANFSNGHWHWAELCPDDYEATVELAADGSTNRVVVNWLNDSMPIP